MTNFLTPPRYDLKEWWSKVTNSRYEKFIPWSGISVWTNSGLDPNLKDQVIFQMMNVDEFNQNRNPYFNLQSILDKEKYLKLPNVDNEFRLSPKFISSNQCERLAIIEDKYEKYHNDLNIALYGNEEQFNIENANTSSANLFYYKKETCEINERKNDLNFLFTTSSLQDFGQSGFYFCQSSDGTYFILGDGY